MPQPYKPQDSWVEKARQAGFRARSVYKLAELDKKYRLLKPGRLVLDLGAAPGGWLQYIAQKIGEQGRALGIDLKEIAFVADNVLTRVGDISDRAWLEGELAQLNWDKFDLIVSDAMPNTTGVKEVDSGKSLELSRLVFQLAKDKLKPKGSLVMKVFEGEDLKDFLTELKNHFALVAKERVQPTRSRSRELYLVCR